LNSTRCGYVSDRVLGNALDARKPSRADARLLASLGREVVEAMDAAAALAAPTAIGGRRRAASGDDDGDDDDDEDGGKVLKERRSPRERDRTGTSANQDASGPRGEVTYPRCFFLYDTLMFFVFKVKAKRVGGGGGGVRATAGGSRARR
jgi:hypothetical protein